MERTPPHLLKLLLALSCCCIASILNAQTTVCFQGFETGTVCNAWSYTYNGTDVVNTETVRTGSRSARVGRSGESSVLTFSAKDISALSGVTLELYHAVRTGSGPGMDVREGVVVQVQLNGGAWTTFGQMAGFADSNWGWTTTTGGSGSSGSGCSVFTAPNPLVYTPPAGTSTLALRVISIGNNAGACGTFNTNMGAANPPASTYDRTDEGFFIDDVSLKTTTTPVPAIWMGSTSTDWHTCTNWLYGTVPTSTLPATIDQRAVTDCVISTAAATCKSLAVASNAAATSRNLTIQGSRKLTVVNDVTVTRSTGGPELGITLLSSGQLECNALTLTGSAAGARNASLRNESALNLALVKGNLLLSNGALLDLQGTAAGGTLQLQGDYTNNDQANAFDEGFSTLQFQGGLAQSINTPGFEERFNNIRMSKTAGDLTLARPVRMGGSLGWTTNGRIFSTATNLLTMEATATVLVGSPAANSRFVSGPVKKLGNADFTFPIGKNSAYRAAQVTGITDAGTGITAEYFPASAQTTFGTFREPTLHHVSDCEYWSIDRTNGADTPYIWLSWASPNSCGVTALPEMRVAYWDGGLWLDRGTGGTTGNTATGTVRTEDRQSAFGAFTLASISAENPLPIQLLTFTAEPAGDRVHCAWTTATEANNDGFTVERSTDAVAFDPVGTVAGAGDSQHRIAYALDDPKPLEGLSYYRLRQTDRDGSSTVTNAVPVLFQRAPGLTISVDGLVRHDLAPGSSYAVFDADGRLLSEGRAEAPFFQLPVQQLTGGIYLLRLTDGGPVRTERFVR